MGVGGLGRIYPPLPVRMPGKTPFASAGYAPTKRTIQIENWTPPHLHKGSVPWEGIRVPDQFSICMVLLVGALPALANRVFPGILTGRGDKSPLILLPPLCTYY